MKSRSKLPTNHHSDEITTSPVMPDAFMCDDKSYVKGLVVAFKLKRRSIRGHAKESSNSGSIKYNIHICQTGKDLKSKDHVVEENEDQDVVYSVKYPVESHEKDKCKKV
jgi:ribosomal 50S subunit-recycling heat shock protein